MSSLDAVADAVGLHPTTVSRILKCDGEYKRPAFAKRAAKVKAMAERMGYRTNLAARAVALQRFNTVGLLQHEDTTRSYLPGALLDGIQAELSQRDMQLSLSRLKEAELDRDAVAPSVIKELNADGLLINMHSNPNKNFESQLSQYRIPAIWLNHKRETDCVYLDDHDAGKRLTQHFLDQGIEHVAYVGFFLRTQVFHYSKVDRQAGYEAAMTEAGLKPHVYTDHHPDVSRLAQFLRDLRRDNKPIAIVAYGHHEIETCLSVLWRDMQLAFRDQWHMGVFQEGKQMQSFLSASMNSPLTALGQAGVEHVMKKINSPDASLEARAVSWDLVTYE